MNESVSRTPPHAPRPARPLLLFHSLSSSAAAAESHCQCPKVSVATSGAAPVAVPGAAAPVAAAPVAAPVAAPGATAAPVVVAAAPVAATPVAGTASVAASDNRRVRMHRAVYGGEQRTSMDSGCDGA
ncbi:hypothetical protein FHG87_002054 [Trinorchestia longiramus]|nr:hypothetical protein FHG87_002054 [Trinorchestia longiramus]